MSDIVKTLREGNHDYCTRVYNEGQTHGPCVCFDRLQAASEIVQLQAVLDALDIRRTADGTGMKVCAVAPDISIHPTGGPLKDWIDRKDSR